MIRLQFFSWKAWLTLALALSAVVLELSVIIDWYLELPNVPWVDVPYSQLAIGVLTRIFLLFTATYAIVQSSGCSANDRAVALAVLSSLLRDYFISAFALGLGHWFSEDAMSFIVVFHLACMAGVAWLYTRGKSDVKSFVMVELACALVVSFRWIRMEVSSEQENLICLLVAFSAVVLAVARRVPIKRLSTPNVWSIMFLWILSEFFR